MRRRFRFRSRSGSRRLFSFRLRPRGACDLVVGFGRNRRSPAEKRKHGRKNAFALHAIACGDVFVFLFPSLKLITASSLLLIHACKPALQVLGRVAGVGCFIFVAAAAAGCLPFCFPYRRRDERRVAARVVRRLFRATAFLSSSFRRGIGVRVPGRISSEGSLALGFRGGGLSETLEQGKPRGENRL